MPPRRVTHRDLSSLKTFHGDEPSRNMTQDEADYLNNSSWSLGSSSMMMDLLNASSNYGSESMMVDILWKWRGAADRVRPMPEKVKSRNGRNEDDPLFRHFGSGCLTCHNWNSIAEWWMGSCLQREFL